VWYWIGHHLSELFPSSFWSPGNSGYRDLVSVLSLLLFAGGSLFFLSWSWRRRSEPAGYPVTSTALGILSVFLLVSKVHSPQYALWLMPFFALVGVNLLWWALYSAADLVMYVGIFRWFYDTGYRGIDYGPAKQALLGGLWTRAALLAILIVVFLRARPSGGVDEEPAGVPAPVLSHPPSRLVSVGEEQHA
ncbi:MAG: hypothetical protein ABR505_01905, partial [Actinomycetota bacterium]